MVVEHRFGTGDARAAFVSTFEVKTDTAAAAPPAILIAIT
jgi:hypothetical protein